MKTLTTDLFLLDVLLVVGPQFDPRVVFLKVNCYLGSVPVHGLPAAGHPAVDGLLAPRCVEGDVLLLVEADRNPPQFESGQSQHLK